ncbi:SusC/RagA family TonB-linked outer membrane protein [Olivibacter sp. SDN3]|uniref:SusC/RagA family TonB-linked outer membrane protein n=1 Tax=Olivibacter sp. SDN3 TaxID=2764720 RepID=UPI001C9E398B|nr:SusC/RagA family TonB-linked outer membrane protein [Olivibacter sp. SDN3]
MKLAIFLSLVLSFHAFAEINAQKITLNVKNRSLREVMREIQKQQGYSFFFRGESIASIRVSASLKQAELNEAMNLLLANRNLNWYMEDGTIVIATKQPEKKPPTAIRQDRAVDGKITDEFGEAIEGVTITAKGTSTVVMSDTTGNYRITVPSEASILVYKILGYQTIELAIEDRQVVNVTLQPSMSDLDEVVVVGYGTMRKGDLTGSIIQIRPDKIANENPRTVQDILRGTPGLNVGFSPSAKGGGSLQIRGQRSVYTDGNHNNPLIILDGMFFYGELSEINPDDIEQIDVLKDASAAAVYGSRAANGVIIISTKRGKPGKPVVNFTANWGATGPSDFRKRWDTDAYLQHRQDWLTKNTYGVNPQTGAYEAYQTGVFADQPGFFMRPDQLPSTVSLDSWRAYSTNDADEHDLSIWVRRLGFTGNALQNFMDGKVVDWTDQTFRTGLDQDYNASVSGASDRTNYYFSMGYLRNEGAVVSDNYRAIRANMKINTNVTDWFELGANVNFQDRSDGNVEIDIDQTMRNSPFADYADEMGNPVQFPLSAEFSQRGYNYDFQRQYLELDRGYTVFNTILQAKIKLPFNITYSFNASPRYQFFYDRYFMSADLPGSDPKTRGANREQAKRFDWSLNNTITWDYTFAEKHRFNVTLVQEAEQLRYWQERIEARNILPSDALGFHGVGFGNKEESDYSSNDTHETADALMARLFYNYDDRYMLTGTIRRDGYSAFGSTDPYGIFPSLGAAWTFTNEDFFKWDPIMSSGKLRVSYGRNGNRSLGSPYLALANLSRGGEGMQGYIDASGQLLQYRYLMMNRLANPHLEWEKTAAWNFGLDFGFLNERISGTLEYYHMSTHDMIMGQRLPGFSGFSSITTNLGQVDNSGVELALNTLNIDKENFRWSTTLGFSYNKNRIKHLYHDYEDVVDANGNVTGRRERDDITNGWFIGQSINTIWNYRVTGIWQSHEIEEAAKYGQQPGDPKVANNYTGDDIVNADGSVTYVYNDRDKEFLGETVAPYHWSLRNEFVLWKDLTFSFQIYSFMGHKSLSDNYLNNDDAGGRMQYALANLPAKEYWTPDNPTNEFGRIEASGPVGAAGAQKLYNRSFIRLDNIAVGYTLPQQWTSRYNLNRVKVFGAVRNTATWAQEWIYGDPETGSWASRTFTLGLNLTF